MGAVSVPFYLNKEGLIINGKYIKVTTDDQDNAENKKKKEEENKDLVNEEITFANVLVIAPDGSSLGVMPRLRALQLAETYSLDLLCVAKDPKIPVCKILDYGKYHFVQQKKEREQKKKTAKEKLVKEIQLSPVIGRHDMETKLKNANKQLDLGYKIKVTMRFKGRQLNHFEIGKNIMDEFLKPLLERCIVLKPLILDKKLLSITIACKAKKDKN